MKTGSRCVPHLIAVALMGVGGCSQAVTPGDGSNVSDAGPIEDSPVDSLGDTASLSPQTRAISLLRVPSMGDAGASNEILAVFDPADAGPLTTIGPCTIQTLPSSGMDQVLDAGTLTVTWNGTTATLRPSMSTNAYGASGLLPPWSAGEQISVTGSGGQLPAFSQSIVFPPDITLIAPNPSATSVMIDSTTPWTLSWQPLVGATVDVVIHGTIQGPSGRSGTTARCYATSAAGSIVIPPAVLEMFSAGAGASMCSIQVRSLSQNVFPLGDLLISFGASAYAGGWAATFSP